MSILQIMNVTDIAVHKLLLTVVVVFYTSHVFNLIKPRSRQAPSFYVPQSTVSNPAA
jgi:hypothetical protein